MSNVNRTALRYSPDLHEPNTWRLLDNGRGIQARVLLGGYEIVSDVELRWRTRHPRDWPAAVFVAPADSEQTLWITAPAPLGGDLLRRELQLERAPEHVAAAMAGW